MRRPGLIRGALGRRCRGQRRVELLDELDLHALEEAVELFDVRLVEIQLADRPGNLAVRQNTELLPAIDQRLDLIKLLKIHA